MKLYTKYSICAYICIVHVWCLASPFFLFFFWKDICSFLGHLATKSSLYVNRFLPFLLSYGSSSTYPSCNKKKEHTLPTYIYHNELIISDSPFFLKKKITKKNSLFTLQRKEFLQKQGITHILSTYQPSVEPKIPFLRPPTDNDDGKGGEALKTPQFKRMVVELDDSGSENIIKHFPKTNAFIQDGLDAGGGVLVHW